MSISRSKRGSRRRPRRRSRRLRVPGWYYALLAAIAVVGLSLIISSMRPPSLSNGNLTDEGDYFQGRADAPVTMFDWSNFQCGHCAQHVHETIPQIEQAYIETGKVRYIFRPLIWDPEGQVADRRVAESLYCAGEQGKFWEMHDWAFSNVERWLYADDVIAFLIQEAAAEVGLDRAALERCLRQETYRPRIEEILADARARGINSTPSFLIGDQPLVGAYPFSVFQQIIEEELAQ